MGHRDLLMHTERAGDDTPARKRRSDARQNRQHILATAKRLFAAQGVAVTNMKDIAHAAGVGKGTLYRHFAHKGELCRALIQEDITGFQERVGALISDTRVVASPLARLDILITERIQLTEPHLPLFTAIEAATGGAGLGLPLRTPFGAWTHAQIVTLLSEAVRQGEVGDLDVAFTADAILAAVAPAVYSYQRQECGYSVERILAGLRRLFIESQRRDGAV